MSSAPRSALVTGGGTGIGRRITERLVEDGYHVAIMGRRKEPLVATQAALGSRASIFVGDVTEESDIAGAVEVAEKLAPLTTVVIAAGAPAGGRPIMSTSLTSWRRTLSVNLDGAFLTIHGTATAIADNGGGSIVAISSVAAATPHRGMAAYAVSKSALEALVLNAANELGEVGVRVNAVRAGVIETDMTSPLYRNDSFVAQQLLRTPLKKLGSSSDVAEAVAFLVGPNASWITGICLGVDGGNHLRGPIELSESLS